MMTLQEIFNTVATHLLKQNAQSLTMHENQVTSCMYRGDNGLKCAVGALITEDCYDSAIEGKRVNSSAVREALVCSGVLDSAHCEESDRFYLLVQLQSVHDNIPVETWPHKLAEVAAYHNLDFSILPA